MSKTIEDLYPDRTDEGLLSDIYEKHKLTPWQPLSNLPIYKEVNNVKIYDNTTPKSRHLFEKRINYYKNILKDNPPIFTELVPSTLTARGYISNISFNEKNIIKYLSDPLDNIIGFGCNYGEKWNPNYIKEEKKKVSGRGRKPKPKILTKRKKQGTGKFFSSQITFVIKHPLTGQLLQIKLFRNGIFQVPGIKNPSMMDLLEPIKILRQYLSINFDDNVEIKDFVAVMRNYKARLINPNIHVNLEKLEEIILNEKDPQRYQYFIDNILSVLSEKHRPKIKAMLKNYNPLNIAEIVYNMDRCFCLIIKFYRPSLFDKTKKTTVKLLKKGKINFDGGNSEQEVMELNYWFIYLYTKYAKDILYDIRDIKNETPINTSDDGSDAESIYDVNDKELKKIKKAEKNIIKQKKK